MTKHRITLDSATKEEISMALTAIKRTEENKVIPEQVIKALSAKYKLRCAYCETPIDSRNMTQRYCSGVCRKRAHREANCTCQLCGEILSSMNDLMIATALLKDSDHESRYVELNLCDRCDGLYKRYRAGNSKHSPRVFFMNRIAKEYELLDNPPHFTEKDLDDMSDDLTRVIEGRLHKRQLGMRIYLKMSKSQTLLRLRGLPK